MSAWLRTSTSALNDTSDTNILWSQPFPVTNWAPIWLKSLCEHVEKFACVCRLSEISLLLDTMSCENTCSIRSHQTRCLDWSRGTYFQVHPWWNYDVALCTTPQGRFQIAWEELNPWNSGMPFVIEACWARYSMFCDRWTLVGIYTAPGCSSDLETHCNCGS